MRWLTPSTTATCGSECCTSAVASNPASAPARAWKRYAQNARRSASPITLNRGQNCATLRPIFGESKSSGSAFSIVASHSGRHVSSSPSTAFCSAIGVDGAGFNSGTAGAGAAMTGAGSRGSGLFRNATSPAAKPVTSRQTAILNVRCFAKWEPTSTTSDARAFNGGWT